MRTMTLGWVVGVGALAIVACAGSARSGRADARASAGSASASTNGSGGSANASANEGGGAAKQAAASSSGAPSATGSERQVAGRIELVDRANEVTMSGTEAAGHAFEKLKLDDATQVLVNGARGTIADVREGENVRAAFSEQNGQLHLDRVEVKSPND